ncbi:RNA-directed DNA polymerase, eukaryota [Tanacetum coccineum]
MLVWKQATTIPILLTFQIKMLLRLAFVSNCCFHLQIVTIQLYYPTLYENKFLLLFTATASSTATIVFDEHTLYWLGEVALKVLYKRLYALEMCKSISVAEKMGHPSLSHSFRRMPRGGVEQENYGLLCSKVADLVLQNISDRWCWSLEGSQEFSVKSSRILIDNTILPKAEVLTRWLRVVPIKVNVHAWRVCLDKLPTRANLSLRGMDISSIACPLCNSAVESTSHIFFACPLARQVWRKFLIWYLLRDVVVNLALQKSIALWEFSTKACSLIR